MAATTDAIALLKSDHRKVEDLFAKFEAAKSESKKKTLDQGRQSGRRIL